VTCERGVERCALSNQTRGLLNILKSFHLDNAVA